MLSVQLGINKKKLTKSKSCGLSLRNCNVHFAVAEVEKLSQMYRKLAELRTTFSSFAVFAVADLSVNLRCPALVIAA